MPNRIIKESICASDSVDMLSWFEEVFFYRLIVNCDDYGRMDACPPILRARLFPLKTVTDKQIESALKSLRTAGIVYLYEVDGKPFLQLRTWEKHQTIRAKKSKFPEPPEEEVSDIIDDTYESNCMQMNTDARKCSRNPIQSESEIESKSESESRTRVCARGGDSVLSEISERFGETLSPVIAEWISYKQERREAYKPTGLKNFLSRVEKEAQTYGDQPVANLIQLSMSNGYRGVIWDKLQSSKENRAPRAENANPFLDPNL